MRNPNKPIFWTVVFALFTAAGSLNAGSLEPIDPPGPTMKTLQEIYDRQMDTHLLLDALASPSTLSDTTTVVNAGYYQATDLTIVDEDLAASNIVAGVSLFGIEGTYPGVSYAYVPRTGQTNSFAANDDGALQTGLADVGSRFTDNGNGTVTDNRTGLIWLRNARSSASAIPWTAALSAVTSLNSTGNFMGFPSEDTSNGGSHQTDWRLPNSRELLSLIDFGVAHPLALPTGHPFLGLPPTTYWTSTTMRGNTNQAYAVGTGYGGIHLRNKTSSYRVWPVRGGP